MRKESCYLLHDVPILFVLLWTFTGAGYSFGHALLLLYVFVLQV